MGRMKASLQRAARPLLLAALALPGAAALAQLPPNSYACEVTTQSGVAGLVLVQASSAGQAAATAGESLAHTMDGARSQALAVVECISTRGQAFSDPSFQAFYQRFPR